MRGNIGPFGAKDLFTLVNLLSGVVAVHYVAADQLNRAGYAVLVGYLGGDQGGYARKHNVFALLSDVANDPNQAKNIVPFTQFATDLRNGALPSFSNIVPNLCNDAHDCSLGTADNWLKSNIAPLLASASFQPGGDGLLIVTFDQISREIRSDIRREPSIRGDNSLWTYIYSRT